MAFVGLFLMFIFIVICIIGFISFVGFIVTTVSAVKNVKRKKNGIPIKKGGLITGLLMFLLPIILIILLVVGGVVSSVKLKIERMNYDSVIDKWENEDINAYEASWDIYKALLEAAESGSKEKMTELFSKSCNREMMSQQIDEFLAVYPKGFYEQAEVILDGYADSGEYREDYRIERMLVDFEVLYQNESYYVIIRACFDNTKNPEHLGITQAEILSQQAYYLWRQDMNNEDKPQLVINCDMTDHGFETRKIHGGVFKFTEIDRTITKEEVIAFLEKDRRGGSFVKTFGEPNVKPDNDTIGIYELASENGKPLYLELYHGGGRYFDLAKCYLYDDVTTIGNLGEYE